MVQVDERELKRRIFYVAYMDSKVERQKSIVYFKYMGEFNAKSCTVAIQAEIIQPYDTKAVVETYHKYQHTMDYSNDDSKLDIFELTFDEYANNVSINTF